MHPYLVSAPGMQRSLQEGCLLHLFQDLKVRSRNLALCIDTHSPFTPLLLVPQQAILDGSRLIRPLALSD